MSLSIEHTTFAEITNNASLIESHMNKARKLAEMHGFTREQDIIKVVDIYLEGTKKTTDISVGSSHSSTPVKKILVPDFQREYVWSIKGKKTEVVEFFKDLEDVFELEKLKNNSGDDSLASQHNLKSNTGLFFGNIIFLRKNLSYEIIDGQQRFTTIYLFLIAFKTWLQAKISEKTNQSFIEKCEEAIDFCNYCFYQNSANSFFFEASLSINPIFKEFLNKKWFDNFKETLIGSNFDDVFIRDHLYPPIPKNINESFQNGASSKDRKANLLSFLEQIEVSKTDLDRVLNNYKFLYRGFDDIVKTADDVNLIKEIVKNIQFSQVTVELEEDAYVFFERTNSRGATLELHDLLKAYIFGNGSKDSETREFVKKHWDAIIKDRSQMDTNKRLISYFYNRIGGGTVERKVFEELKQLYPSHYSERSSEIRLLVEELEEFSLLYYILINPTFTKKELKQYLSSLSKNSNHNGKNDVFLGSQSTNERVNKFCGALQVISSFENKIHIPLVHSILAVFYKYGMQYNEKLADMLTELFVNIEKIHFRLKMRGLSPRKFESTYHRSAKKFALIILTKNKLEEAINLINFYKYKQAEALGVDAKIKKFVFKKINESIDISPSEAAYFSTKSDYDNEPIIKTNLNLEEAQKIVEKYNHYYAASEYLNFLGGYFHEKFSDVPSFNFMKFNIQFDHAHLETYKKSFEKHKGDFDIIPSTAEFYFKGKKYNLLKGSIAKHNPDIEKLFERCLNDADFDKSEMILKFKDLIEAHAAIDSERFFYIGTKQFAVEMTSEDAFKIIKSNADYSLIPHTHMFRYKGKRYSLIGEDQNTKEDFKNYCNTKISDCDPSPLIEFKKNIKKLYEELISNKAYPGKEFKQEIVEGFAKTAKYKKDNTPLLRYIFDKFNNTVSGDDDSFEEKKDPTTRMPIFEMDDNNKTNYTIDHFYPQEAGNPEWLHSIGNLMMLSYRRNSTLNATRPLKKTIALLKEKNTIVNIFNDTYRFLEEIALEFDLDLDKEYTDDDEWNTEQLEEIVNNRTKALSELSYKLWEPNIKEKLDNWNEYENIQSIH